MMQMFHISKCLFPLIIYWMLNHPVHVLIHLVPLSHSHSYTFLYIDNFYVYLHIDFFFFLYSIQMNCWTYTMYRERRSLFKGVVSRVSHKYN